MSKRFDACVKHLLDAYPRDWARLVGVPASRDVQAIEADLSTVTAQADKVLEVSGRKPWLIHFELQASYDAGLGERSLRYNVLLRGRMELPVRSVIVLLRPEADGPAMAEKVVHRLPGGKTYLRFRYDVVRLWQVPVERLLAGGLGTLPLAPLARYDRAQVKEVYRRLDDRLRTELPLAESGSLETATYVLMGLRFPREVANVVCERAKTMEESTTYQAILEKGEARGFAKGEEKGFAKGEEKGLAKGMLLALLDVGTARFGAPTASVRRELEAIPDVDRLRQLTHKVATARSWRDLLNGNR